MKSPYEIAWDITLEHVKRRNKEIEKFMRYKRKKEIDIGW